MPQEKRNRARYTARLLGFALLLLVAGGLAILWVMAWGYTWVVLHPGCQGERSNLADFGYPAEPVTFTSPAGYDLRGWYSTGSVHPEIAIIVLPGHAGNTTFALPDAVLLAEAGYSTLIYEHRSCANPALTASTGYWESFDLQGAVDYLLSRPDVSHIGALGFSEGGTAILLAASREPALEALVPMGGYSDLVDDIIDPRLDLPVLDRVLRRMIVWATSIQNGAPAHLSSPISGIAQVSPRPTLLIYGEYEMYYGQALYQAAGENVELWIVPGSGHGGYQTAAPDAYRERILAFFMDAFPG